MRYTVHRTNKRGEYNPDQGVEVEADSFARAALRLFPSLPSTLPKGKGTTLPGQRCYHHPQGGTVVVRSVYPCPEYRTSRLDLRDGFGVANSAGLVDIWESGPRFHSFRAASSAARAESGRGWLGDCWPVRFVYDPTSAQ